MGGGALVQTCSRDEPAVEIGLPEFRLRLGGISCFDPRIPLPHVIVLYRVKAQARLDFILGADLHCPRPRCVDIWIDFSRILGPRMPRSCGHKNSLGELRIEPEA